MNYKNSIFCEKIKIIKKQKKLTDEVINQNLIIIEEFLDRQVKCKAGPMSECKQLIKGLEERLATENGNIYIRVNPCAHWIHDNPYHLIKENFLYSNFDLNSFNVTFEDFIEEQKKLSDDTLKKSLTNLLILLKNALNQKPNAKGVYLYGKLGVGKTYLMKCLANSFALKNKTIAFITANEIIKKAKESISSFDSFEYSRFEGMCKRVDVLFIDDIGAESVSEWSRDEILFAILNFRMEHKKLTCFTSNKSLETLEKTYINKKMNGTYFEDEMLKASRFVERIKSLTFEFELRGKNKRY